MNLRAARAVADTVLYEGYLLYPYRASAAKNRSRWQFGVLGPPAAAGAAFAEPPSLSVDCLLEPRTAAASLTVHVRFLQVQRRETRTAEPDWDEAVEHEITLDAVPLRGPAEFPITVPGGVDEDGPVVRRRWPLTARVRTDVEPDGDLLRLTVAVTNEHPGPVTGKREATRRSLIGAHLLIEAHGGAFLSMQDPPPHAAAAAARCRQHRSWPVLAGSDDVLLCAPIILYDNPRLAEQSPGPLFDATEIDELLALRVMTLTEDEKAEARATDERARAVVDRCDALTPAELSRLHGVRRDPATDAAEGSTVPWWDPAADAAADPETAAVVVDGVRVAKGSLVRIHPSRRADAQDLFYAGRVARVTAVVSDVDGGTHVALVLTDDPGADLHDWYGRYLYFAPDEIEPLTGEGR
ncbi:hypothetical protein [Actinoplanes regularis]|uniref:Uncharacterized protein n=1 Tax=Actinoplanes regularis TaxID=52697 RepID=A0A239F8F8_9ACTN|nr:hypothetical protein [Actinoplanes regularis]GIE90024.1 hypothetical protein Are01nite_65040 [Actinoplanes regularis]SNS53031.1 hypothetical protein SAMN06264365_117134 [Actinoplanes regularis]